MFCKKCGKQLTDNAKFCDSCGHKVGEDITAINNTTVSNTNEYAYENKHIKSKNNKRYLK